MEGRPQRDGPRLLYPEQRAKSLSAGHWPAANVGQHCQDIAHATHKACRVNMNDPPPGPPGPLSTEQF